jgi:hypothetical protein
MSANAWSPMPQRGSANTSHSPASCVLGVVRLMSGRGEPGLDASASRASTPGGLEVRTRPVGNASARTDRAGWGAEAGVASRKAEELPQLHAPPRSTR